MSDSQPELSVDLGIAQLTVRGGEGEQVSDIQPTFDEEFSSVVEQVKELKRLDFDLVEEYRDSGTDITPDYRAPVDRTFD